MNLIQVEVLPAKDYFSKCIFSSSFQLKMNRAQSNCERFLSIHIAEKTTTIFMRNLLNFLLHLLFRHFGISEELLGLLVQKYESHFFTSDPVNGLASFYIYVVGMIE